MVSWCVVWCHGVSYDLWARRPHEEEMEEVSGHHHHRRLAIAQSGAFWLPFRSAATSGAARGGWRGRRGRHRSPPTTPHGTV